MVALAYDNGEVQIMTTTMSSTSSEEDSMQNIKLTLAVNECLGWIEINSEGAVHSLFFLFFHSLFFLILPHPRTQDPAQICQAENCKFHNRFI